VGGDDDDDDDDDDGDDGDDGDDDIDNDDDADYNQLQDMQIKVSFRKRGRRVVTDSDDLMGRSSRFSTR
jgi:hypothetical protein